MFLQRGTDDANNQRNTGFRICQQVLPAVPEIWPTLCKTSDVADKLSILNVAAKIVETVVFAEYGTGVAHKSSSVVNNASSQLMHPYANLIIALGLICDILEKRLFCWKWVQSPEFHGNGHGRQCANWGASLTSMFDLGVRMLDCLFCLRQELV
jgi:hypothetical protein